jgi:hypothetical protein
VAETPVPGSSGAPRTTLFEVNPLLHSSGLYRAWTIALTLSLTLSLGVRPALRGTYVGIEHWIDRADSVASFLGQSTALGGAMLLLRFLVVELPRRGPWHLSGLAGLLATVPLIAALSATRGTLSSRLALLNALVVIFLAVAIAIGRLLRRDRLALVPALFAFALTGKFFALLVPGLPSGKFIAGLCLLAALVCATSGLELRRKNKSLALFPFLSADFFARLCRGTLDPVFPALSSNAALLSALWCLLPLTIIFHLRGKHVGNVAAPLFVLSLISPITPLSLLAATIALLFLLPETPTFESAPVLQVRPAEEPGAPL